MNSFGRLFRVTIFGESHGEGVGINIDGCPAGLQLPLEDFLPDLERRKGGVQKGTTPRKEDDLPIFRSGLFNGVCTGAPVTILFENNNTRSGDYEKQRAVPRPGHADFVAHAKFGGFEDYRGGGAFSARLTVGLVAAGVIAKKMMGKAIEVRRISWRSGVRQTWRRGFRRRSTPRTRSEGSLSAGSAGCRLGWVSRSSIRWSQCWRMRRWLFRRSGELSLGRAWRLQGCLEASITMPSKI